MERKEKVGEFQKQGAAYLQTLGLLTRSLVQENTSANNVLLSARFKRSNQGISTIRGTRSCFNAPTPVVGNGCSSEALRVLTGTTGNPDRALALARARARAWARPRPLARAKFLLLTRIIADLEAKRKATSEDKSGNEVAADGATAAQSHEEDALRSLPLEGLQKDSPGSTSAQADNNEKVEKTWFERIGALFPHVLNATMLIVVSVGVYILSQNASQVTMLNEKADVVAYQVKTATLKAEKKVDKLAKQLKAAEKKVDKLAKQLKAAAEKKADDCAKELETCEKFGSKVDELLKAPKIESSPYTSYNFRIFHMFNRETGTSEGQGWRKAG